MLSLRRFDSAIGSATCSEMVREHMASTVLEFSARPNDSLPALIASFAHPVHVDSELFDADSDSVANNGSQE